MAACNAGMKTVTKRNLHAAMAINNFRHAPRAAHTRNILQANGCFPPSSQHNSSAGLAAYNSANNGMNSSEAHIRMAVTVGLGVLAAAQAVQENNSL